VMFIFLFLTFASVISFMKIVGDRTAADSAEVLAMQITEAVQTAAVTPSISSKITVPLPRTIPEKASLGSYAELYTVDINEFASGTLSVAIGWGVDTPPYIAASSVQLSGLTYQNSEDFRVFSGEEHPYLVITKSDSSLCIQKCKDIPDVDCIPEDVVTCQ
jgi:hypothetical protein